MVSYLSSFNDELLHRLMYTKDRNSNILSCSNCLYIQLRLRVLEIDMV